MLARRKNKRNILEIPLLFLLPGSPTAPLQQQVSGALKGWTQVMHTLQVQQGGVAGFQCHHSPYPHSAKKILSLLCPQPRAATLTSGKAGTQMHVGPSTTKTQLLLMSLYAPKAQQTNTHLRCNRPSLTPLFRLL